jgi:hypothetical protein
MLMFADAESSWSTHGSHVMGLGQSEFQATTRSKEMENGGR